MKPLNLTQPPLKYHLEEKSECVINKNGFTHVII